MALHFVAPQPLPTRKAPRRCTLLRAQVAPSATSSAPPTPRRSKLILTRRVHAWALHTSSTGATPYNPRPSPPPVPSVSLRPPPAHPDLLLDTAPPVHTFVVQRGLLTTVHKRRYADPPHRYLRISYGLLTPLAPGYATASNPRAAGTLALKKWYATARRWRLLAHPSSKLLLSRRFSPTSTAPHQHAPSVKQQQQQLISPINRALGISPRLIVVGDVHGCIHELQQLLRLADYTPGDQVIFLGDLVAKGPDSPSVVQLAREIGAKTVRGNHDYEVIRFWEARRRGDHAIVSPEHAAIATKLSTADVRFLGDAPWFIEAADMKHLFVHAGFIPRVKLTQQNPRLMMNMRSVLKDGTVTAKSVVGYEWAKLWQGPHTVVFGHDACRGLQHFQYARGIDTGCVYGGRLTALLLPENRLISVAAKRAYVSPRKLRTVLCDQ